MITLAFNLCITLIIITLPIECCIFTTTYLMFFDSTPANQLLYLRLQIRSKNYKQIEWKSVATKELHEFADKCFAESAFIPSHTSLPSCALHAL